MFIQITLIRSSIMVKHIALGSFKITLTRSSIMAKHIALAFLRARFLYVRLGGVVDIEDAVLAIQRAVLTAVSKDSGSQTWSSVSSSVSGLRMKASHESSVFRCDLMTFRIFSRP